MFRLSLDCSVEDLSMLTDSDVTGDPVYNPSGSNGKGREQGGASHLSSTTSDSMKDSPTAKLTEEFNRK